MFWDSLPDGWGELLVKRYLAKQGINYDRLSPLTKLSLIGENGLGGLNYEPSQFAVESADAPDFDTLAREVDKICLLYTSLRLCSPLRMKRLRK